VDENTLCEDGDYSAAESVLIARGSLRNSRYDYTNDSTRFVFDLGPMLGPTCIQNYQKAPD